MPGRAGRASVIASASRVHSAAERAFYLCPMTVVLNLRHASRAESAYKAARLTHWPCHLLHSLLLRARVHLSMGHERFCFEPMTAHSKKRAAIARAQETPSLVESNWGLSTARFSALPLF